jgi:hypothetical protein
MKRLLLLLIVVGLLLSSAAVPVMAAPGSVTNPDVSKALAAARKTTAKYHDVGVALADGYFSTEVCVEHPVTGDGMGIHYVNAGLAGDLVVDELSPEILLYAPTNAGDRLVGVEYFMIALANTTSGPAPWFDEDPPPLGWFTTAPTLFGRLMDGPMEGHDPGMPWHYDLHVWLWESNPDGIFEDFNPNVSCS